MISSESELLKQGLMTPRQLRAITFFQKKVKSRYTFQNKDNWQIFSHFDIQDEAEKLELAGVLQIFLETVPNIDNIHSVAAKMQNDGDEDDGDEDDGKSHTIRLDSITISSKQDKEELNYESFDGGVKTYVLPRGPITIETAEKIVEIYRTNGKLHPKAVRKILRDTYKALKSLPNITRVEIPYAAELTVVGDIHGQLHDLLYILDQGGAPSEHNLYLFNGDFVDRGSNGLEVTMVIFAYMLALPDSVFLNRGNHEEYSISCVYGFEKEVKSKYDELHFSMFMEVFRFLPIATVFNDVVLTIHGGLFGDENVLLDDLMTIPRTEYIPKPPPGASFTTEEEIEFEQKIELMRGALWSDPWNQPGIVMNARGAGVMFGSDVTRKFMENNGLELIVRSHECVQAGFHQPFLGHDQHLLCTVFSASNYGRSGNKGAFLKFSYQESDDCFYVGDTGLYYVVHNFTTSDCVQSLDSTNKNNLVNVIIKRKRLLFDVFNELPKDENGAITVAQWAKVMQDVTGLQFRWSLLHKTLINPEAWCGENIDPIKFLNSFKFYMKSKDGEQPSSSMLDALYCNKDTLITIFSFFDTDGNGTISRDEFRKGCEIINQNLPNHQKIHDPDKILKMIDFDSSDGIDLNEFLEAFRLVDAMDGEVDGVIGVAPS